jgi:hypothetical protein
MPCLEATFFQQPPRIVVSRRGSKESGIGKSLSFLHQSWPDFLLPAHPFRYDDVSDPHDPLKEVLLQNQHSGQPVIISNDP